MKDLYKIPFKNANSSADVYNAIKSGKEKTSLYEAKRTMEAIGKVRSVSLLSRRISE